MTEKIQYIPARQKNAAVGGHIGGTEDIIDDALGKEQSQINQENIVALNDRYTKDETYSKEQLNSLITTPNQQYVNLSAEDGDTLADIFDGVTGAADTIYRVGSWNGEQYDATVYSEYAFDGTNFVLLEVKEVGIDDEPTAGSDNLVKSGGVMLQNCNISMKNNIKTPLEFFLLTNGYYITYDATTQAKKVSQNDDICYCEIPIDIIEDHSHVVLTGFGYVPSIGSSTTYTKILFFDSNNIKLGEVTTATDGIMAIEKPVGAAYCYVDVPISHKSELIIYTVSKESYDNEVYKDFTRQVIYPQPQELIIKESRVTNGSIYISVSDDWVGRIIKSFNMSQSQMAEFLETTLTASPNGLKNCIEIPSLTSLVIDTQSEQYLAIKNRADVLTTDIILISCTHGRITRLGHGMEGCVISAIKKDIDILTNNLANSSISIDSCTHGSLQPDGGVDTELVNCVVTPYIRVAGGSTIYFPYQSVTYNGEEYFISARVVGTQDDSKTGAHMITNHTDFPPKKVKTSNADRYIRMSFYFYHKVNNSFALLDGSVDALTTFAGIDFCFNISNQIVNDENIVDLNKNISDIILPQFKKNIYNQYGTPQTDKPFVLLHFSDLHADSDNLKRLMYFYNHYKQYIDDCLFTGDGVSNIFNNSFSFWAEDGAEKVLFTIGNHDTANYSEGAYDWTANAGINAYNKYIAPYVANWGVTQPSGASANGLCYYYKDYSPNIRLIVVDDMSIRKDGDAAQISWFENVLANARNDNKCVLVAAHHPNNITPINSPFTGINGQGWIDTYPERENLVEKVDDFISAGGKFIAWLTGHSHRDMLGKVSGAVNNQLNVVISTATCNENQSKFDGIRREADTKSADLFNIFKVDTYQKVLTLYRVGSDFDTYGRHIGTVTIDYENCVLLEKF